MVHGFTDISLVYGEDVDLGYKYVKRFFTALNTVMTDKEGQERGIKGEERVRDIVARYGDRYSYITNLVLPNDFVPGETAETDMIIVTNKAVFVLEIKNRGEEHDNQTLRISKDGRWDVYSQDRYLHSWDSPVEQNIQHKIVLEDRLKKMLGISKLWFDVTPVIVIANDDINIINESNNTVIRASEVINYIEMYPKAGAISDDDKMRITMLLKGSDVSGCKRVKVPDYLKALKAWGSMRDIWREEGEYCKELNEVQTAEIHRLTQ